MQITRGDYLQDLITIYLENNTDKEIDELYDTLVLQCGSIQKFYEPVLPIKVSFDEQESMKLQNTNVAYLAGITKDGHKETFNGSISFNTRGEVVFYEPPVSTVIPSGTSAPSCDCRGLNAVFSNCSQPAIKAYFVMNWKPEKLSQLQNDTDFQDGADVAQSISAHNASTEAHPYIQGLIEGEVSVRASQTEALEVSIAQETSIRASQTEALAVSIGAETTAREEAISLAIQTTEAYTDTVVQGATTAINTTIGTLSSLTTTSTTDIVSAINSEVSDRQSADNNLQGQIDALSAASDVKDIVGTYADLENYDTSHLGNNDIIKVLNDETHDNQPSYYRYNKSTDTFSYIGSESAAYTKAQSDSIFVTKTTEINGHALSSDINLTASDVGALPSTTTIGNGATTIQRNGSAIGTITANQTTANTINVTVPTATSQITNDSNFQNATQVTSAIASGTSDLANQDLSNLSNTGNARLHALKSYSDEGELLTDSEGLADIKNYAHSTYCGDQVYSSTNLDLSKFVYASGNRPIIVDGITNNLSYSNNLSIYLTQSTIDLTNKSWKLSFRAKFNNKPSSNKFILDGIRPSNDYAQIQIYQNGGGGLRFLNTLTGNNEKYSNIQAYPIDNTYCDIELVYNKVTNTYTCNVLQDNNLYSTSSITDAYPLTTFMGFLIGSSTGNTMTIDLKYVKVEIDGIPVFSGNKTGVDTIKADDWTPNGTPTISADGIISNIDSSNFIYKTGINLNANSFKIKTKINVTTLSGAKRILEYGNSLIFQITNATLQLFASSTSGSYDIADSVSCGTLTVGIHDFEFEFTGSQYIVKIDNEITKTITNSNKIRQGTNAYIFSGYGGGSPMLGEQNLNAFKIYVNGSLVYQPCLKIPYTESKTGSKIVNSVYRDRVSDMYEQFGYAPYYTLSDTDFSLPEGDLYGLIERVSDRPDYYSAITVSDINGSSKAYTIGEKCLAIIKPSTPASTYTISVQPAYGDTYKSISGYGYMTLEFDTGDKVYASVSSSMDLYLIR